MEIILIIVLFGLIWGAWHFFGLRRRKKEVLSNPSEYSQRNVNFYKKLSPLRMAILSFFTALVPVAILFVVFVLLKVIEIFN